VTKLPDLLNLTFRNRTPDFNGFKSTTPANQEAVSIPKPTTRPICPTHQDGEHAEQNDPGGQ
jgi:hypothetical protein